VKSAAIDFLNFTAFDLMFPLKGVDGILGLASIR
jgi:hypothetical protein